MPALPAPPAPTGEAVGSDIYWTSLSGSDPGGRVELYQANQPSPEFATLLTDTAWAASGIFSLLDPGYYWLRELGNDVDYAGRSDWSTMLTVV